MKRNLRWMAMVAAMSLSAEANAHEFWLDAVTYTPKVGAKVPIVLRNGTGFLGDSYPYERKWIKRFVASDTSGERAIKAVEGDDPAAEVLVPRAGLAIVAVERAPDTVDYKTLGHFLEVLEDEGYGALAARFRARPDAPQKFQETYSRFAKALLAAGSAQVGPAQAGPASSADKALGQKLEIVVETNPYIAASATHMSARVLHDGKPLGGAMVKVFSRPRGVTGAIEPRRVITDADGRVQIDRLGSGEVLLNVAHFMPLAPLAADETLQTRWQSLWASSTFAIP